MSTILGSTLEWQPIKFGWSRQGGHHTTKEARGTEAQVRAQIPGAVAVGATYDVERMHGDIWKIVITYPQATDDGAGGGDTGGDEIVETWELQPKDAQKDLLGSYHSLVSGLTQTLIDQIKTDKDDPKCGAIAAPTVSDGTGRITTLTGDALKVLKLLKAGVENVEIEQPVLSVNWTVPTGANLGYAYSNIGRIYTTASLISAENPPSDVAADMTAWTASFSNPTYGTNRISLVFGWKKRAPTQRTTGQNRREVSQTWEFGLWATDIYGATV